jgi:hypothetical protein
LKRSFEVDDEPDLKVRHLTMTGTIQHVTARRHSECEEDLPPLDVIPPSDGKQSSETLFLEGSIICIGF